MYINGIGEDKKYKPEEKDDTQKKGTGAKGGWVNLLLGNGMSQLQKRNSAVNGISSVKFKR